MQKTKKTISLLMAGIILATILGGCSSTRTENGVSIEQGSSLKFW